MPVNFPRILGGFKGDMKKRIFFQNPVSIIKAKNPSQDIHWHDNFELIVVLKGLLNLQIGFEKFILDEGALMIVNSLESHRLASLEKDTEVLFISLDKAACLQINPDFYEAIAIVDYSVGFAQLRENQERLTKSVVALLKSLPQDETQSGIDRVCFLGIHERMTDLINLLSSVYRPKISKGGALVVAPDEKISMIYRMISYLYENYNKTPSLDDFLQKEHYSLYYMSHVIAEITGTSFRDWLTYVRVEASEKLLLSGDLPISTIAHEVGFSSVRYYNTNFRKWYGTTPSDFRRLFKQDFEAGIQVPSGDLVTARNFLNEYLTNHINPTPKSDFEYDDKKTIFIHMKEVNRAKDERVYPQVDCMIDWEELSRSRTPEHLALVKTKIDFNMLRIIVPSRSPGDGLKAEELDSINHFTSKIKDTSKTCPQLANLKMSAEPFRPGLEAISVEKAFELIKPCLLLRDLITIEGLKTPYYFLYSLLSHFKGETVRATPWSLVAKNGNRLLVFAIHKEASTLAHKLEDFKICIDGISGAYKLTTYKCDFDFWENTMPVKDPELMEHLTPSDYELLNIMHEPKVTFELITFHNSGEIRFQMMGNSCRLFVFDLI